jgi:hypothetical protein
MTLCFSFILYKVKETFGGFSWKLRKLMHVSRFMAYVTSMILPMEQILRAHQGPKLLLASNFTSSYDEPIFLIICTEK